MNNPRDWMNGTKQKFSEMFYGEVLQSKLHRNTSSDKLPPRLQRNGISVAARIFGNEIRNFTKRTTGKDLAQLKNSKTRQFVLTKLAAVKIAITNKDTQYGLVSLAYNHSLNLASSLSPEGSECAYNFKKNNFIHEFIAKYHKDCIENYEKSHKVTLLKKKQYEKYNGEKKTSVPVDDYNLYCKCNSLLHDKKTEKNKFLNCWQHKGIKEEDLDRYLFVHCFFFT